MRPYKVKVSPNAKGELKDRLAYLVKVKHNKQAATNVMQDYRETRESLSRIAGSIKESDSKKLRERGLKRINFRRHDYFLLFRTDGEIVTVTNIFHFLEDYENKLK